MIGRNHTMLSVGDHVTVLQLVRGPTSARLRSALGRWNPVEQTGLCIYSCFRTYRLELFNRVLPNQPTYVDHNTRLTTWTRPSAPGTVDARPKKRNANTITKRRSKSFELAMIRVPTDRESQDDSSGQLFWQA
jgi:hypothetical protein